MASAPSRAPAFPIIVCPLIEGLEPDLARAEGFQEMPPADARARAMAKEGLCVVVYQAHASYEEVRKVEQTWVRSQ